MRRKGMCPHCGYVEYLDEFERINMEDDKMEKERLRNIKLP